MSNKHGIPELTGAATEQQYPPGEVKINEGEKVLNKTSWEPSGKNKIEHRHEKHPDEYKTQPKGMKVFCINLIALIKKMHHRNTQPPEERHSACTSRIDGWTSCYNAPINSITEQNI